MGYNENLTDAQGVGPGPLIVGVAAFTGAGASAVTVATSTILSPRANLAQRGTPTLTRNGAGDHTITLAVSASPTVVYAVIPVVDGTSGLDVAHKTAPVLTSGALVCRIQASTAAGVATDLTTADNLRLIVIGSNNSVA